MTLSFILTHNFDNFLIKIDSSEYVIQFLLRLDLFQMKIRRRKENTSDVKKKANIVAFSSIKPYAAKNITFQVFIQRSVY